MQLPSSPKNYDITALQPDYNSPQPSETGYGKKSIAYKNPRQLCQSRIGNERGIEKYQNDTGKDNQITSDGGYYIERSRSNPIIDVSKKDSKNNSDQILGGK